MSNISDVEKISLKGILATMFYLSIFSLFILIPFLGFIMFLTLSPYLAGFYGGKHAAEGGEVATSLGGAIIWLGVIFFILNAVSGSLLPMGLHIGVVELVLIITLFMFITVFASIGGYFAAQEKKFEKEYEMRKNPHF